MGVWGEGGGDTLWILVVQLGCVRASQNRVLPISKKTTNMSLAQHMHLQAATICIRNDFQQRKATAIGDQAGPST